MMVNKQTNVWEGDLLYLNMTVCLHTTKAQLSYKPGTRVNMKRTQAEHEYIYH